MAEQLNNLELAKNKQNVAKNMVYEPIYRWIRTKQHSE